MEQFNPSDKVTIDIPLFIRLLEYAREDAKTDMDLHNVAEKAIAASETGKTLTMTQYDSIVKDSGQEDASYASMANENTRLKELAGIIKEDSYGTYLEKGGDQLEKIIIKLLDIGFHRDIILDHVKDILQQQRDKLLKRLQGIK